jgi:hypothetical protein
MKSSYFLRNITDRTVYANGSDVIDGPAVSTTYPLGYFREDYGYIAPSASLPDYLDDHNGRFCVTPEYPKGIYCYFATVDANWNSAYPYIVGPTFFGVRTAAKVTSITETVSTYTPSTSLVMGKEMPKISIMPNPASEVLAVQISNGQQQDVKVELIDLQGRIIAVQSIFPGSTMAHFDVRKLYAGDYLVRVFTPQGSFVERVVILKD